MSEFDSEYDLNPAGFPVEPVSGAPDPPVETLATEPGDVADLGEPIDAEVAGTGELLPPDFPAEVDAEDEVVDTAEGEAVFEPADSAEPEPAEDEPTNPPPTPGEITNV